MIHFESQGMSLKWKLLNLPEEMQRDFAVPTPHLYLSAFHGLLSSLVPSLQRRSKPELSLGPVPGFTRCPGRQEGLKRGRDDSSLWPCRRASWESWGLTELLVPKLRGQNSWQRGKWGRGWSGISLVQCVSSPPLMVLLLPVGAKCPVSLILKVAYACGSNGKHSLWFQRGNFIPIWSLRENPSPRALHGIWWMVSEWMRANQRWIIDQCCWLSGWRICL